MSDIEKLNILLVDDQPAKLLSYEVILRDLGENLVRANSAKEAFEYLLRNDVAILLVDAFMPDMDGFQLAQMVRDHPRFRSTAIIFISAVMMTDVDFLKGYQAGAVDYVSVPVIPEILRAKVKVFSELYRKTRQLEQLNRHLETRVHERTRELEARNIEIQRNEERMRLAFEAAELGWWEVDAAREWVSCSLAMADTLTLPQDGGRAPLGELIDRIHEQDRAQFSAFLDNANAEQTCSCELRLARRNGSYRWGLLLGRRFQDGTGAPAKIAGINLDISARKTAEERMLTLLHELDHRAKNLLAIVQSVIQLTRADNIEEFRTAINGRVRALRVAHSLLSESRWDAVDLRRIIEDEIQPFLNIDQPRVTLIGPRVLLAPPIAQGIALVIHEMITNSVKYGALSVVGGRVHMSWQAGATELTLDWTERHGPPVEKPAREGFGTKLILATTSQQLGGNAMFDWHRDGLRCTLTLPFASAEAQVTSDWGASPDTAKEADQPIIRVMLVEDEAMIALMMSEELTALGYQVVGPFSTLRSGLTAARAERIDCAILDLNIGEKSTYPIADALHERSVPFAFMTGYSRSNIEPRFALVPVLEKPIDNRTIRQTIEQLIGTPIPVAARFLRPCNVA